MKRALRVIILGLLLTLPQPAPAAAPADAGAGQDTPWSVAFRLRNYVTSHTSYEFGNPFPPYQKPLSRLEFPLDSVWAGVEVRRDFPRMSVGIEALRNVTGQAGGKMRDSDWDDDDQPDLLTIYSSSDCRLEPSYTVRVDADVKVSDWLGLPPAFDLRPVLGFRWQRFSLTSHDGTQYYPAPGDTTPPLPLPGEGIAFEQTYRQIFLGFKAAYRWETPSAAVQWLSARMQADWAYVSADNEDHHLLRAGRRFTYEGTKGEGWHILLGLEAGLTGNFSATLEADWLRLETTGFHRLVNDLYDIHMYVSNVARVWSQQTSLSLGLKYTF